MNKEKVQEKSKRKTKKSMDEMAVIPYNLLPFLQCLWWFLKVEKENKFKCWLNELEVSMPFMDVVMQILKKLLTCKDAIEKTIMELKENATTCSILQQSILLKLKDPCSFSIPCVIGEFLVGKTLCDLGESVSIMPYSLSKKHSLQEATPTNMTYR